MKRASQIMVSMTFLEMLLNGFKIGISPNTICFLRKKTQKVLKGDSIKLFVEGTGGIQLNMST